MAGVVDDGRGTLTVYGMPRYGQTPQWIFDLNARRELSSSAVVLYGYLMMRYSHMERGIFPSHRVLADERGCAVRTVRNLLQELRRVGALTSKARSRPDGGQASNVYTMAWAGPHAFGPLLEDTMDTDNSRSDPVLCTPPPPGSSLPPPPGRDLPPIDTYRSKKQIEEPKPGVDQSRSDPTTQTSAAERAAARRPRTRRKPLRRPGPAPGAKAPGVKGSPEHSFVWAEIIGRHPGLSTSPLRFKTARILILALLGVPEGDRPALGEQLKVEMEARAPSTGPDGPSDALRAASEAVAAASRAPDTPEAIRARLAASQAPPVTADRPGRCPVHEVALTAAGVCPCCRADKLAGLYDDPAPGKPSET